MSKYDREYYVLSQPAREDLPTLTPDEKTAMRSYRSEPQPAASAPLIFFNGAGDYQRNRGIEIVKVPPAILFDRTNPVVDDAIREVVRRQKIPHLHIHPAVYVHDDGRWYENYWYLAFTASLDCWISQTVSSHPDPKAPDEEDVCDFHLRDEILDATPLDRRRLFQMGDTYAIVCHESMIELFGRDTESGAQFLRVDDYGRNWGIG